MSATKSIATLDDLQAFAQQLAARLRAGDVVTLAGDLGAGKTTLAQGIIHTLSLVPVEVTSPTFTLLHTYPVTLADGARCEMHHYDLYRIDHPSALIELGLEEALQGVTIIEWPERLGGYQLPITLALSLGFAEDGRRTITAHGGDARFESLFA